MTLWENKSLVESELMVFIALNTFDDIYVHEWRHNVSVHVIQGIARNPIWVYHLIPQLDK